MKNVVRERIGEAEFIFKGSDMSLKCPNRGCKFTASSLLSVVGYSASCSKCDNNDPCVDNMETVDRDGRRTSTGNQEWIYGNAEKKKLNEEIL